MIDLDLLKKVLQLSPDATDDEINASMDGVSMAMGEMEREGDPEIQAQLQTANDGKLKANNLVNGRDQSGQIRTVHKNSPEAKELLALSAQLLPKIRRSAASRISPTERAVMQKLGLTEAQWLRSEGR